MFAINIVVYFDFSRLLRREGVGFIRPDFMLGLNNYVKSLALAAANAIEMLQQTGFRLFVLPFVGLANLAVLSTLRTVANVVQQGISTIINPGTPELMRVIAARDADRTSAIMCFLWLLILLLFAPAVVGLQVLAPYVFSAWTLGKMAFDGSTFSFLAAALMVAGLAEPARAIIRGNNLLRAQVAISISAGAALISFTWLFAADHGIVGAAAALFTAECFRSATSFFAAKWWLKDTGLVWPQRHFVISGILVLVTATTVLILPHIPGREPAALSIFILAYTATLSVFWRELPADLRARANGLIRRMTAPFSPFRPSGGSASS
jgi:O-antigen/teichoic acid export membrane protein